MKRFLLHIVIVSTILTAVAALFSGCDEPLFTELNTSRMKVVFKGTYESHSPRSITVPTNTATYRDNSFDHVLDFTNDAAPTEFMIDIAEIRLVDASGDHETRFANYRQTLRIPLDDAQPFFNGTGIELTSDDVSTNVTYKYVRLYLRKTMFNGCREYRPSGAGWDTGRPCEDQIFDQEEELGAFDFNQLGTNTMYDNARKEADRTNRVFPLTIPIRNGLTFDPSNDETVLEIRLNIKNYIKMFEHHDVIDDDIRVYHYWGMSDWLWDVHASDPHTGGNLFGAARSYVASPTDHTGSVTASTGVNNGDMVIMVRESTSGEYDIDEQTRTFKYDTPELPDSPGDHVTALLNYYMEYEKYYIDGYIINNDTANFDSSWANYQSTIAGYSGVPEFAAFEDDNDGSVTFTNVPDGTYYIYRAAPASYGALVADGGYTPVIPAPNNYVTVTNGSDVSL